MYMPVSSISCMSFIVARLSKSLATNVGILEKNSTLLTISRLWRYCGPSNYRFNFLLYWYEPWVFFWVRQCAFVFPIYVRKYRKWTIDRWIVVYTVCASAVISPLRQWLDSYAKTRLKMWHPFKHFIHMQYFLLPTNLVIVFVHWVSTVVCCTNPVNVHCFGTIFPNLNFVFASICAARPVHIQSDQYRSCSTVNKVNNVTTRDRCSRHSSRWGATKNSAVALSSRNNMIPIYQRSTRTNEGKTTLI